MAVVALLAFKRVVQERLHQLRRIGLVRIVALNAIGRLKGLAMVGLHDRRIFHVMTVNAQCRRVFGQVIGEFALRGIACLVNDVAGVAATVERRMAAAALGNMHPDVVTGQAEILRLVARNRLQQQGWVVRLVWVVALQTIASVGRMDPACESEAFLSAWQVKQRSRGVAVISFTRVMSLFTRTSWQLRQPPFIVECTDFAFGFVRMALDTFRRVDLRVERGAWLLQPRNRETDHRANIRTLFIPAPQEMGPEARDILRPPFTRMKSLGTGERFSGQLRFKLAPLWGADLRPGSARIS